MLGVGLSLFTASTIPNVVNNIFYSVTISSTGNMIFNTPINSGLVSFVMI